MNEERNEENEYKPSDNPYEVEKEWASKLGMRFDEERLAPPEQPLPPTPPPPVPPVSPVPPHMYRFHEPMPPTYMVWAIISTICCCLPAGIVAIFFSSQVSTRYYSRDYEGARRASERAEIWIIAAIVAGVIVNALYFPLMLMFPS